MAVGKIGAKGLEQFVKKIADTSIGKRFQQTDLGMMLKRMYVKNPQKFAKTAGFGTVIITGLVARSVMEYKREQKIKADFLQMQQDLDSLKKEVIKIRREQLMHNYIILDTKKSSDGENHTLQPETVLSADPSSSMEDNHSVQPDTMGSNYKSPVVGENGIEASEITSYYTEKGPNGNRVPKEITYYSDKNKKNPVYKENLNPDGSLETYSEIFPSKLSGYYNEHIYDPSKKYMGSYINNADSSTLNIWKDDKGWNTVKRDVKGRPLMEDYAKQDAVYYEYLENGNHTEKTCDSKGITKSFVEKDKVDSVVQQKFFKDGILDYTIHLERDSAGAVVKTDTVYNNKKSQNIFPSN